MKSEAAAFILMPVNMRRTGMDRYYARAYMKERLEEARHRRLVAAMTQAHGGASMIQRLRSAITALLPWWEVGPSAPFIATPECGDLDCCAA